MLFNSILFTIILTSQTNALESVKSVIEDDYVQERENFNINLSTNKIINTEDKTDAQTVYPEDQYDDLIVPKAKNGIPNLNNRWHTKVIPYKYKNLNFNQMLLIRKALNGFEQNTCLRFRWWFFDRDYIEFSPAEGCYSYLGRIGGGQQIGLADGCFRNIGVIYHEVLHALGFAHEQSRHDRDEYVRINYENLLPNTQHAFRKINGLDFGVPYDYGSVMHYYLYAFSKDPKVRTIIPLKPLPPGFIIGGKSEPSRSDYLKLNRMYNCTKFL